MAGHHFFVDPSDIADGTVTIKDREAHHAARVLRVTVGERITAADGSGRVVDAVVRSISDTVEADVEREMSVEPARPHLTLFQAAGKGDKLEIVVEKATEVGVARIVPFIADRSVVKWDERKLARVHDRLRSIARAAAKQSRSPFVPDVTPVVHRPEVVDGATVVLHEGASARLRDVLPVEAPERMALVIGPEGGLSEAEIEAMTAAGAVIATLGPRILRTETAGPVAIAVVGYAYGWFG